MDLARNEYKRLVRERRIEIFKEFVQFAAKTSNYPMFQKSVCAMKVRASSSTCQLDPDRLDLYAEHFKSTFGAKAKGSQVPNPAMALDPTLNSILFSSEAVAEFDAETLG